ncbi:MAG TPA: sulfatase-like hydrolase/transferase, partial [Vicinamibacterales bacterium]|nr:sulfatase-like hydrolase/transferase [Vicinamibacterales bacterium]
MARRRQTRQAPPPRPTSPATRPRWTWIAAALAVVIAVVAIGWSRLGPGRPGAIVLVSIDTLRADRLPLYGYASGRTPRLDALARESVVFEKAYAHAPQTLPSHASMLTGLLPFDHGVRDNLGFTLGADHPMLQERLKAAGYRSGGFVSAYVLRHGTGIARGFDVYDDEFPEGGVDRSPGQIQRGGADTLAAAVRWMDSLADERFFLFLHLYEPHKPYTPPSRFQGMNAYDGEIAYSDEIVGQLADYLARRSWLDRSTFVVTADHGEGLGDHGEQEHGLFVYDESIRVPLLVKLPGSENGGRRVAAPVQHIDLFPTIGAIAALQGLPALRGRDLSPALHGTGTIAPQGIYSEALYPRYHFGWSELLALTDERFRYIQAPRPELYDLERDPDERTNLVRDRAQAAAAMRAALDALVAGRDLAAPDDVSAADRERLAALGYVGTQFGSAAAPNGSSLPDPKDMAPVLAKYRAAIEMLEAREFMRAADAFRDLLRAQPEMTDVWVQYAAVLTRLGRDAEAYQAYRQVVQQKPGEPSGLLGAAAALIRLERLDEARQHALLAVAKAPANAHDMLTTIAVTRRNFPEARRQAALAAQADPGLPLPAYVDGLEAYFGGRYDDALPLLKQAYDAWTTRTIQTPDLRFYLADTLARLERYPEAERYFREELQLYPTNLRARSGLA